MKEPYTPGRAPARHACDYLRGAQCGRLVLRQARPEKVYQRNPETLCAFRGGCSQGGNAGAGGWYYASLGWASFGGQSLRQSCPVYKRPHRVWPMTTLLCTTALHVPVASSNLMT